MAIKGKGRSKRRGVAAAPKPAFVQPKKPLLARRGVQIGILVFIFVVAATSIAIALVVKHNHNKQVALKEAETQIVRQFGSAIDNAISGIGQPFQTTFNPFPTLATDLTDFQKGTLSDTDAASKADEYNTQAKDAATSIEQINTAQLIEGHADLLPLNDSQTMLGESLQTYEEVAHTLKLAAQTPPGVQRNALLRQVKRLNDLAARIFSDGYQRLINQRSRFNLLIPTTPTTQAPPSPIVTVPITSSPVPSGGKHKK
jgi:hypothetical protein